MAHVATFDELLKRISDQFEQLSPIWGEATTTTIVLGGNSLAVKRLGWIETTPSLPTGVSSFIPTEVMACRPIADTALLVARLIDLGNLNIAGPTFTDGSAMPTLLEGNTSRVVDGAILMEVTTALNATPGSITVTYVDQDGNTAETTSAQALGASSPVRSSGWIALNSPDYGARDITSATRTGGTTPTGVVNFWGIIPIAMFAVSPLNAGGVAYCNLITESFNYIQLPASATLGVFGIGSQATEAMIGTIRLVGDSV